MDEKKCINCKYHTLAISQCRCINSDSEYFGHMVNDNFYCGRWDGAIVLETQDAELAKQEYDYVHHPSHYGSKDDPYECIKVMRAYGLDKNFCLGNAFKYLVRAGKKPNEPQIRDLEKAVDYINMEIGEMKRNGNC